MSALRKEGPLTTADIAGQEPAGRMRDVVREPNIDPADRRPPQSAAGSSSAAARIRGDANWDDANPDDTYDGEVVSSSVDPLPSGVDIDATPPTSARPARVQSQPARQSSVSSSESGSAVRATTATGPDASGQNDNALFDPDELRELRGRWDQVQTSFVDEPRQAVEQADTLVATIVKRIAEQFAEEREKLEQQWHHGSDVSTEDLRQGLKRYRALFDRLLSF